MYQNQGKMLPCFVGRREVAGGKEEIKNTIVAKF